MESTAESGGFKCDCQRTGYRGSTCESGIVFTPQIPSLTKDESETFEITAFPDAELKVEIVSSFARTLTVTPKSITFTPNNTKSRFNVTSYFPGQYGLRYSLSSFAANDFNTPEESPFFVREPKSDRKPINAYFNAVRNDPGFLNESCCRSSVLEEECPMNVNKIRFLSTCEWKEPNNQSVFESNGIVFAQINSLTVPLSVSGLRIGYNDEGAISSSLLPSPNCKQCPNNANVIYTTENCYYYKFDSGDIEDFLSTRSLAQTFFQRIQSLFPDWASVFIPSINVTSESYNPNDFAARLTNHEDVRAIDGCSSIFTEEPGIYSILSYSQSMQLNLDGNDVTHNMSTSTPMCFAVNLCQEMESPVFVGLPREVHVTLKNLPVFQSYLNKNWSFSIDSVTLYNTARSVTVYDSYWNGVEMIYLPNLSGDFKINTTATIVYSSSQQGFVQIQLGVSGVLYSLFDNINVSMIIGYYLCMVKTVKKLINDPAIHFNNNLQERKGSYEGESCLNITTVIDHDSKSLFLTSSKPTFFNTSGK